VTDLDITRLHALAAAALEVANRNTSIARALADGYRSGVNPPDVVLEAYFASFDRDEARLAELRNQLLQARVGT
jgi:hypothetical protein